MSEVTNIIEGPQGQFYAFPDDILELWQQANEGLITWEYFVEEAEQAARDGRLLIVQPVDE